MVAAAKGSKVRFLLALRTHPKNKLFTSPGPEAQPELFTD